MDVARGSREPLFIGYADGGSVTGRAPNSFKSHFQSFAPLGGPAHGVERTRDLRAELARLGLDGFIVPRADQHQNEYVAPSAERLLWLTGFAGSAGLAIVLQTKAALFIDGRYIVQARTQVDTEIFATIHSGETTPSAWIEKNVKSGERIGYDPWLHTRSAIEQFAAACSQVEAELVPSLSNPIDAIWVDRPPEPLGAVTSQALRYSGESARAKVSRIQSAIKGVNGVLVTDSHDVAWLLNIRGSDVAHTPLPLSFAYVPKSGRPTLFLDGRKLSNAVRARLEDVVGIEEPARLVDFVSSLGRSELRVAFDISTSPEILVQTFEHAGGKSKLGSDTIGLMKARKNNVEIAGAKAANKRDGAAVTRFLHWIKREAQKGTVTEISAAEALESFRRESGRLKDISFPTISAAGPHSALPHYRVTDVSNAKVGRGLFLIDSGGQYEDGTTDITRTIAVGKPTREMRERFTRVLKGHIAIASAVFPKGTTGAQIDALARQPLWCAGLDFDHGTGHGIGSYLSVHEGPQRIAKTGTTALQSGMILSNEPGYYAPGRFGIRIENLLVVRPIEIAGAEREMLGFETISLAPIDLDLIDEKLLNKKEIAWLDVYHSAVRATLSSLVDPETRVWLAKATRKVGRAEG
jgi:Xaa-Pro aminopeptidase